MLEALKRSNSTENFISQSSSSEECLHTSQGDRLQYSQGERLQYSLESVGSMITSEEEGDMPGTFFHYKEYCTVH
jgi:hypothetical protein